MSPDGSNPDCHYWTRSGFVLCDPPPLSCGRMGGLFRPVTEMLQKRHVSPAVSCIIFVNHTGTGGVGGGAGGVVVSLE